MSQCWAYISSVSILVPVVTAIYKYNRLNKILKILFWLLVFGAMCELIDFVLLQNKLNNIWLFNLYSITEGFALCYLIGKWFNSKPMFRIAMTLFVCFSFFWFYSIFISNGMYEFNSAEKTVKGIILIFLSGYLLILLSMDENLVIGTDYRFWISTAILFYFSMTLVVFSTANLFLDNHRAMHYSWTIHSIINIITNLIFAYGFICYYRKTNSFT